MKKSKKEIYIKKKQKDWASAAGGEDGEKRTSSLPSFTEFFFVCVWEWTVQSLASIQIELLPSFT